MSQGQPIGEDERRALQMLADAGQSGCSEHILVAQGFTLDMLAGLVRTELASVTFERTQVGGQVSVVAHMRITDAGRSALSK